MGLTRNKKFFLIWCGTLGALSLLSTTVTSCGNQTTEPRNITPGNIINDNYVSTGLDSRPASYRENCEGNSGGSCLGDSDCEDICEDLFSSGRDEDECKDLSVGEVNDLYKTFDDSDGLLKNPDYDARNSEDELSNVCIEAIATAISIEENFWKDIYDDYNRTEAKDVLIWFAQNESVYLAIDNGIKAAKTRNNNDDVEKATQEFLETLFNKVGSNSIIDALTEGLDSEEDNLEDNTFFVYASENLPDDVLEIVHKLAADECPDEYSNYGSPSSTHEEAACLIENLYCEQHESKYIFEDVFESFLEHFEDLEDYLEEVKNIKGSDLEDPEEACV